VRHRYYGKGSGSETDTTEEEAVVRHRYYSRGSGSETHTTVEEAVVRQILQWGKR
jgi:hypothetical protein